MDGATRLVADVTMATVTAAAAGLAVRALRIPPVVGYLLAGLAIGPFTGGYVADVASLSGLGEVGLIFLVFTLGLDFSPRELREIGARALSANILAMTAIGACAWTIAARLGAVHPITFALVVPLSSTAIGIALLRSMGAAGGMLSRIAVTMLVSQDLLAVIALVLVSAPKEALTFSGVAIAMVKGVAYVVLALVIGATLLQRVVRASLSRMPSELLIPCFIALALAAAWLGHFAGLSLEFGAFLAGAVISEAAGSRTAHAIVAPFRELFVMLFFVSLGMLLDVRAVAGAWGVIFTAGALLIVIRASLWFGVGRFLSLRLSGALALACAMVPLGEFNMVLASAALSAARLSSAEFATVVGVTFVTILFGAGSSAFLRGRVNDRPETPATFPNEERSAEVVLIGFGRVGAVTANLVRRADRSIVVIESDARASENARRRGLHAITADGTDPTILDSAIGPRTELVVSTIPDTHANVVLVERLAKRGIASVARAVTIEDVALLRKAGAKEALSPEAEGALDLARAALRVLDIAEDGMNGAFSYEET